MTTWLAYLRCLLLSNAEILVRDAQAGHISSLVNIAPAVYTVLSALIYKSTYDHASNQSL